MIEHGIQKPVSVIVGVLLVVLFGILGLSRVPIQLTPDITKPEITVETSWRGASPHEVEREIIDEQEEQLKGVEGAERITSECIHGMGTIRIRFPPGTDMDSAVLKVSNRLEQVPEYPEEADKPVILTASRTDNAMAWFILLRRPGNNQDIDSYYLLCEDYIKPRLERVEGVAVANVMGGREEELQVIIRPADLAARGLTVADVLRTLDRENANVSAGDFDEGKRMYLVRSVGEYRSPEDVKKVVLETRDGKRVYVRDVADVRLGLKKRTHFVRQKGEPALAVNSIRRSGANVLEAMNGLRKVVRRLNETYLHSRGLHLVQVYDETEYITDSITRVIINLLIGSFLAITVLFLFLRNVATTVVIGVAIPISLVGSFILLFLLGRSVNVISLAGMTFAAGMVVDNSIVSLENIFRLRQEGKSPFEAALAGARGIWGAILASTLTTIAVFLPVLFVEEQAGQLFKDIAIAISCSVGLSLVVAVTVIPTMAARVIRQVASDSPREARSLFAAVREFFPGAVGLINRSLSLKIAVVLLMTGGSVTLAILFLPETEYLPEGDRNLAVGLILPPPGASLEEISQMGKKVEQKLAHRFTSVEGSDAVTDAEEGSLPTARAVVGGESLTAGGGSDVGIENFFFVARGSRVFMGAVAAEADRAGELIPVFQDALSDLPGVIAVAQQASLFQRGLSAGRSVDIEITGPELKELVRLGSIVFFKVLMLFPPTEGHQARPIPSLDLQNPELHIIPDRERARDLGLDAQEIGIAVDAILDGIKASEYKSSGREIDLTLMGGEPERKWRTQDFENLPIHTPQGRLIPLGSVAEIVVTRGPQEIDHIERARAITIQLIPASRMPIERALNILEDEVVAPLAASGDIGGLYDIRLAGTADDLNRALGAFKINFLLAVVITFLLLCALLEDFIYPLVILFSVPLAAVGGVLCLVLVDRFIAPVNLDILTMLGFVILVGVVVNNAILIVYQALQSIRSGSQANPAIVESVRLRIRPIFMSALTSGIGMLPLVLFPGAGSELYRGLGSVVVGGLFVSTLFTIFLVPAVFSLVFDFRSWIAGSKP